MIVSPTEPPALTRVAGAVSMLPENYGADILVPTRDGQWAGVQRKEVKDLVASLDDGRLAEQIAKMKQLEHRMILIEGDLEWTNDGELVSGGRWARGKVTRRRYDATLWSAQGQGFMVTWTSSLAETVRVLQHYEEWRGKEHRGQGTRGQVAGQWGTPDSRDYLVHLLTGLPGVGVELAGRVVDQFGGVPLQWTVTKEQLLAVDGLGKKKVDAMTRVVPAKESAS